MITTEHNRIAMSTTRRDFPLFRGPRATTPLDRRSAVLKHPPRAPYIQKGSLPAMPRYGVLCRAVPRCGTVCRAIFSRVAWLVVSFLYSFVGKSAASLVFKRRQREGRRRKREREKEEGEGAEGKGRCGDLGEGKTEAKGKRWSA